MTLIKSISGIRGTIGGAPGENLTPLDLVKFTSAYGRWLRENNGAGRRLRVVVGRDARLSGEMAASIVTGTLCGCGIDVIDIGLATTPTVEMAVTGKGADGGIILTASHNPGQWNALKLLGSRGEFLSDAEGKRVLAIAADDAYDYPGVDALGHVVFRGSYDREHIDRVLALPLVDREAVRRAGFRVVVDAVNSVGGVVMPVLFRELGCEVVEMNCTPDGRFAHTPEPIPENLTDIAARVPSERADLGVVVDPDVDRLALVCEDGTMFGESMACSGPVYRTYRIEGDKIRIRFDEAEGLAVRDGRVLRGFAVAGADRRFHWAEAAIDGCDVVVGSPEVPYPLAVRYGWDDNPDCNLINASGLPASPFRTDRWPGITTGKK